MLVEGPTPAQKLGFVGFLIGGFIGFLMRPAAPLVGQLPFMAVLTRGDSLQRIVAWRDEMLISVAEQSFNLMVGGAVVGLICGVIIASVVASSSQSRR